MLTNMDKSKEGIQVLHLGHEQYKLTMFCNGRAMTWTAAL